jgi:hypothetical protein
MPTKTSSPYEYIVTSLNIASNSPMFNTAVGVCHMRDINPYEIVVIFGQPVTRWQAIIAEGMMLYSIAQETAR